MRLGKNLIGNPVFGANDGRRKGEVKDLYIDADLTCVVGLYLGREGLLRPTPRFVETSDIALFGVDALFAEPAFTVYEGDEAHEPPGWLRLEELRGREVRTPGGTRIGKVDDLILGEGPEVEGIALANLSVKGPVAEADGVSRAVLVDVEDKDGFMTIDLAAAEQSLVEVDPERLFTESARAVGEGIGRLVERTDPSEEQTGFGETEAGGCASEG